MPTGLQASARALGTGWATGVLHSAHPRGYFGALPPSSLQEQELLEEALSTLAQMSDRSRGSSARVPTF